MKLKIELEYEVDATTLEEAEEKLAERFAMENMTATNEFWENLFISNCLDCGISLNLDEEREIGKCVQCENR